MTKTMAKRCNHVARLVLLVLYGLSVPVCSLCQPAPQKKLQVVIIAVSFFDDKNWQNPRLELSIEQSARDLEEFFKAKFPTAELHILCSRPTAELHVLCSRDQTTADSIRNFIRGDFLNFANGTVTLFFVISHGKPDPGGVPLLTSDLLVVASDTDSRRPREHSVSVAQDIVPYFQRLEPGSAVFAFLDTCYSSSAKNLHMRISEALSEEYGLRMMVMASSLSQEQSYQATFSEALLDLWKQSSLSTACTSPRQSASTLHKYIDRRLAPEKLGKTEGPEVVIPFYGDFCMESFGADNGLIVLFNTLPQRVAAIIDQNDEEPIGVNTNEVVPYKLTRNKHQLDVFDHNNVRLVDEPVDLMTEPVVFKLFGATGAKTLGNAYLKAADYVNFAGFPREQAEGYKKRAFASFVADDEYRSASGVASVLRSEAVPLDENWERAFALSVEHRNQSEEKGKGWRFGPGGVHTETEQEKVLEVQVGPARLAQLEKLAGDFAMAGDLYKKVARQARKFAFQAYFAYGAAYQPEDAQRIRSEYELSFERDCPDCVESEQAAILENSPRANEKFASLCIVRALAHLDY